jgi:hypothetical protein
VYELALVPQGLVNPFCEALFERLNFRVFGAQFGVFFPENDLGQNVVWQRIVRSEIPKEYAILLLPALSRYFASVSTSDINAATLRQALPDLFASAAFRFGQGIAIVAKIKAEIMFVREFMVEGVKRIAGNLFSFDCSRI